ncbi:hypothetical protein [Paracoccus binzhouensis]|uniref:hypothetical protein n=1 Tax=Paracoccus binzhouensis TaxID=2796149 RepID=UPI0018EF0AA7|nr:hypothetical protein [Paracoccus binzhouensis]
MRAAEIRARLERPYAFGDCVDLRGIDCADRLVLDGAVLTGFDLSGARFPQGISARGAQFRGLSRFRGIEAADADFAGAVFHADARFDAARIGGRLAMPGAEFRGVLQFDGAELQGGVDLAGAVGYGNCSFERAGLGGVSDLHGSEWLGGLWLESASFQQIRSGEMLVHGRLWTRRARLAGGALPPERFDISFGYTYA